MKVLIYTDGASRGNPGHASYGFSMEDISGKTIYEEGSYIGIATNNYAEYSAVLAALKHIENNFDKSTEINFLMDSKLVAEQLSGRYKIKSSNLIPLINQIRGLEKTLGPITYKHIPRKLNYKADSLANKALDSRLT